MSAIKDYIKTREQNNEIRQQLSDKESALYNIALQAPFPKDLRPATAGDVICGNVFYYPNNGNPFWEIIAEVRYPSDDFKAYIGEDGCRYGLDGAFVEKK